MSNPPPPPSPVKPPVPPAPNGMPAPPPVPGAAAPTAPTIPLTRPGAPSAPVPPAAPGLGAATMPVPPPAPPTRPTAPVPPAMPGAPMPPKPPTSATIPLTPPGAPTAPGAPSVPLRPGAPSSDAVKTVLLPQREGTAPAAASPGQATGAMPSATRPLTAPVGSRPAGLSTKAVGSTKTVDTDEEEKKESTFVLVMSIIGAILMISFCIIQYQTDQIPDRAATGEHRVFGDPKTGEEEEAPAE